MTQSNPSAPPDALTYATLVLRKAADLLDADPDEQLARHIREQAMEWADRAVTRSLPSGIPATGYSLAAAALPPIGGATHGQYAATLRTTAEGLRGGGQ